MEENLYNKLSAFLYSSKMPRTKFEDRVQGFLVQINTKISELPGGAVEGLQIQQFLGFLQQRDYLAEFQNYLTNINSDFIDFILQEKERQAAYLNKEPNKESNPVNPENIIPFINRERELEDIMASAEVGNIPAKYFIVSAPSGYGKSVFLKELSRRIENKKKIPNKKYWDYGFVKVLPTTDPYQLYLSLVESLKLEINNSSDISWGYRLSGAWIKKYNPDEHNGLVLLIDFENSPNDEALSLLITELIPKFQKNLLANLEQYQKGDIVFRVIIAGRNLSKNKLLRDSNFIANNIYLSAFNHDNVSNTIHYVLPNLPERTRSELAAHILFFTGGHPGAMGEILIRLRSGITPIDEIRAKFEQKYWNEVISKYANEIALIYSQDDRLAPITENIQFFRYLNNKLFREFVVEHNKENENEGDDVIDHILVGDFITGTHLYWPDDSNFLVDAIARRLMISWLRHNRKPNEFLQYSQKAQITCERLILQDRRYAGKWFLEYIFQEIQRAKFEDTREKRNELLNRLFSETIPYATRLFLNRDISYEDKVDECNDLLAEIYTIRHWEFRFLFNYQLRDEYYNDDPIKKLVEKLKETFAQ